MIIQLAVLPPSKENFKIVTLFKGNLVMEYGTDPAGETAV